jgi:protein-L-isoaspartate(D-aspartate) O-methyltransferase
MIDKSQKDKFTLERQAMVQKQLKGRDIVDLAVLRAMGEVPREKFIPAEHIGEAYYDGPVPIGHGQTISQPYIVALMTQALEMNKDCDVLEIGTGSGYQTAIISKIAREVFTIERIEHLSIRAQRILAELGITNVNFHIGDGSCGWPGEKQFDRIMITAAAANMPDVLMRQLKTGGLAVAPIGGSFVQNLVVIRKSQEGVKTKSICGCRFVKLVGKFGYAE